MDQSNHLSPLFMGGGGIAVGKGQLVPENPSGSSANSPQPLANPRPTPPHVADSPGPGPLGRVGPSPPPLLLTPQGFPPHPRPPPPRSSGSGNERLSVVSRSVREPRAHAGRPPVPGEGGGWQPWSSERKGASCLQAEEGREGPRRLVLRRRPSAPKTAPEPPPLGAL